MSDTVQPVAESLTDEFGRYVKPPRYGTVVWKIGKCVSYRRPSEMIADPFMVVWAKREASQVFLASFGTNDPQIYSVFLDDPFRNGYIFDDALNVYRELEREAVAQLEYIQRAIVDNTGVGELHRLEVG